MKWTFHSCVALLLVGSSLAQAQNPAPAPVPVPAPPAGTVYPQPTAAMLASPAAPCGTTAPSVLQDGCGTCGESIGAFGPRVWASAEYLLFFNKRTPVPEPLVTTGSSTNPLAGVVGQPDTAVLFGDQDYGFGATSGAQVDVGFWLDTEHTFGIEARGFWLTQQSRSFGFSSNGAGNPPLTLPFFDQNPGSASFGTEAGYSVAQPAITDVNGNLINSPFAGSVAVSLSTQLWGAELNGVWMKANTGNRYFECFAGVRYARLVEKLNIGTTSTDLNPADGDIVDTTSDGFDCENNFIGGQIGAQVGWIGDCWSLTVRGQVAVGDTNEEVHINGSTTQTGANAFAPGTFPGGVYTEPSNIGSKSGNEFSALPELKVDFGFRLLTNLYATVGYDILWWSNVIEPGNQIDRNLNLTQNAVLNPPGTLNGTANPIKMLNKTSNYYTQGLTFGLAYRY